MSQPVTNGMLTELVHRLEEVALDSSTTISIAESFTDGQLTDLLSMAPRAGEWYRGGISASNTAPLLLGIPNGGARMITPNTVNAMARSAASLFNTSYAASLAGAPGPEHLEGNIPGTVLIATFARGGGTVVHHRHFTGPPEQVITLAIAATLSLLISQITGITGNTPR